MGKSKNELAWHSLFEEYDIINKVAKDNFFNISAKQINKYNY